MKLTRRERAAMELALEVLRERVLAEPCRVPGRRELLEYAAILQHGSHDLSDALLASIPEYDGSGRPEARARLALYLRARLRAAAGDCGRWWAVDFPRPVGGLRVARFRDRVCAEDAAQVAGGAARRIAGPWWQQPDMPSHGGGR